MTQYFDDMVIGSAYELGRYTFTAEEIVAFAKAYDPQPFHIDAEAAKDTLFGGLIASGWHTAAIWMKLMVAHQTTLAKATLARGEKPAKLGPSPGFRDLKWLAPVRPGDTLSYRTELSGKEDWPKRPSWGLVLTTNTATNADGVLVFQFTGLVLVERRVLAQEKSA
jgi:acyl dehydratase